MKEALNTKSRDRAMRAYSAGVTVTRDVTVTPDVTLVRVMWEE